MVKFLVPMYFGRPRLGYIKKSNCIEFFFNVDFLEEGLGLVSAPYFVYDFSSKIFLMLYSIN